MASTAIAMWPWPVNSTTGNSASMVRISGSQSTPLKPGRRLGNEKQGWNEASDKDHDGYWEYTLNLSQGNGHNKEYVGAKYFVMHADSGMIFDPVIIVGR